MNYKQLAFVVILGLLMPLSTITSIGPRLLRPAAAMGPVFEEEEDDEYYDPDLEDDPDDDNDDGDDGDDHGDDGDDGDGDDDGGGDDNDPDPVYDDDEDDSDCEAADGVVTQSNGNPIVLVNGVLSQRTRDLDLPGLTGKPWVHRRTYSSRVRGKDGVARCAQGARWMAPDADSYMYRNDTNYSYVFYVYVVDALHKIVYLPSGTSGVYNAQRAYQRSQLTVLSPPGYGPGPVTTGGTTSIDVTSTYSTGDLEGRYLKVLEAANEENEGLTRIITANSGHHIEWAGPLEQPLLADDIVAILGRTVATDFDTKVQREFINTQGGTYRVRTVLDAYKNADTYDRDGYGRLSTVQTTQGWSVEYINGSQTDYRDRMGVVARKTAGTIEALTGVSYYYDSCGQLLVVHKCQSLMACGAAGDDSNNTRVYCGNLPTGLGANHVLIIINGTNAGRTRYIASSSTSSYIDVSEAFPDTIVPGTRFMVAHKDELATTMYRYYRGLLDGSHYQTSQMRMAFEPEAVAKLLAAYPSAKDARGLTGLNDSQVSGYASRTFTYYTDNLNTDNAVYTQWNESRDLGEDYGGTDFDESCPRPYTSNGETRTYHSGYVQTETISGSCTDCGGGGLTNATRTYYYMDGPSTVRLIVEDTTVSGSAFCRRVYGVGRPTGELKRYVYMDSPQDTKYWCESRLYAAIGQVIERRTAAAHRKEESFGVGSAADVKAFLDPWAEHDEHSNDYWTTNTSGLIHKYTYDSMARRIEHRIQPGRGGSAQLVSATVYGNGSLGQPSHLPVMHYKYPMVTNTVGDGLATTYAYWSWGGDNIRIRQKEVFKPIVDSDKNGSGSTACVTYRYYDVCGRQRWFKDGSGTVMYYSYRPDMGALAYVRRDVDTETIPQEILDGEEDVFLPWDETLTGQIFSNEHDYLNLVTKTEYDDRGRAVKTVDPSGVVTYTVHLPRQVRVYRAWDSSEHKPLLPVQVAEFDIAGRATSSYSFDARYTGSPSSVTLGLTAAYTPSGVDTVPLAAYTALSVNEYDTTVLGRLLNTKIYHSTNIPGGTLPGTAGTHYYATTYGYDSSYGRLSTVTQPDTTVTRTGYDSIGRTVSGYKRAGSGTEVKVSETEYDSGGIGNGLVTRTLGYYGAGTGDYYETQYQYDWRGRRVGMRMPGSDPLTESTVYDYDDRGRIVESTTFADLNDNGAPDSGEYFGKSASFYDEGGRLYRTQTFKVTNGVLGSDTLTTDMWYDIAGRLIKRRDPNGLLAKTAYDSVGRVVASYLSYDDGSQESQYGAAASVANDTVIQQAFSSYLPGGQVWLVRQFSRNDGETGVHSLHRSSARVTYTANWYDMAGRLAKTVRYGTNEGGEDLIDMEKDFNPAESGVQAYDATSGLPSTPNSSALFIVSSCEYDGAGRLYKITDNTGRSTVKLFDAMGRATKTIEHYDDGTVETQEFDADRTTEFRYDVKGRLGTLVAYNPKTAPAEEQKTRYVYGSPVDGSWVTAIVYPDSSAANEAGGTWQLVGGNSDYVGYTYDCMGRQTEAVDQRGTTRGFTYDSAGRLTTDTVTSLGGADGYVRKIGRGYDDLGRLSTVTSYGTSDVVRDQVKYYYGDWGTATGVYQSHSGTVGTGTPVVNYWYEDGAVSQAAKYLRLAKVTYPGGQGGRRSLYVNYPDSGIGYKLSRPDNLAPSTAGGTTSYASYTYLGAGTIVAVDHPAIGGGTLQLSYGSAGTYNGWDRFGRVVDQQWIGTGYDGTLKDRFRYGYDLKGNLTWREVWNNQLVFGNKQYSEYYGGYDGLDRLTGYSRGPLVGAYPSYTGVDTSNDLRAEAWGLDALGNWRTYQVDSDADGTPDVDQVRGHNQVNEIDLDDTHGDEDNAITGTGGNWFDPVYDAAGNMIKGPDTVDPTVERRFVYDAWNRLVAVRNAGDQVIAEYRHDGLNRRIAKIVADGPGSGNWDRTDYYYNEAWQVLEERQARDVDDEDREVPAATTYGQTIWDLRYVDAPVMAFQDRDLDGDLDDSNAVVYYSMDANMNVTALVNASGGNVVQRYVYDPYGRVQTFGWCIDDEEYVQWVPMGLDDGVPNEVLYAGYRWDPETGLYHVRNRSYAPHLGRWLQRDPAGYADGMGLYTYASVDPIGFIDPNGLWKIRRMKQARAEAEAEDNDNETMKTLAHDIDLNSSEFRKWAQLKNVTIRTREGALTIEQLSEDTRICRGEVVTIPNTAFIDASSYSWGAIGWYLLGYKSQLQSMWESEGLMVIYTNTWQLLTFA